MLSVCLNVCDQITFFFPSPVLAICPSLYTWIHTFAHSFNNSSEWFSSAFYFIVVCSFTFVVAFYRRFFCVFFNWWRWWRWWLQWRWRPSTCLKADYWVVYHCCCPILFSPHWHGCVKGKPTTTITETAPSWPKNCYQSHDFTLWTKKIFYYRNFVLLELLYEGGTLDWHT